MIGLVMWWSVIPAANDVQYVIVFRDNYTVSGSIIYELLPVGYLLKRAWTNINQVVRAPQNDILAE